MKIRLICYEEVDAWILGKFAKKMQEHLNKLGHTTDISKEPDKNADINHHIIYINWDYTPSKNDTLMITHIDNIDKLEMLKKQMEIAKLGICMSREHMYYLAKMGINKNKLCYINPAQDGIMPIKKIVLGWANQVHPDGRKNEQYLDRLIAVLNPMIFKFKIMGKGWEEKVNLLRKNSFEVDYIDKFDYVEYLKFIPSLDYYVYMGMDEGQMGVLDALASGIKTIITTQGYHLDLKNGIMYGFTTYKELETILLSIQAKKMALIDSVANWNWENYCKKHLELWNFILNNIKIKSSYQDGYNSLVEMRNIELIIDDQFTKIKTDELKNNLLKQQKSYLYYDNTKNKKNKLFGKTKIADKRIIHFFGIKFSYKKSNKH